MYAALPERKSSMHTKDFLQQARAFGRKSIGIGELHKIYRVLFRIIQPKSHPQALYKIN